MSIGHKAPFLIQPSILVGVAPLAHYAIRAATHPNIYFEDMSPVDFRLRYLTCAMITYGRTNMQTRSRRVSELILPKVAFNV